MSPSATSTESLPDFAAWYVLKAQIKREALAVSHIKQRCGLDTFCPHISYFKPTRTGKRRYTEALFPGYIFVYCTLHDNLRHLNALPGVRGVVKFNQRLPQISPEFIHELQQVFTDKPFICDQNTFQAGSEVRITQGPFANFVARVCTQPKGNERVGIFLDFLGQTLSVKMDQEHLLPHNAPKHPGRSSFLTDT